MTDASPLRAFLDNVGLSDFAPIFEDNDIDLDLLPDLNEDDLKELGLNIGQRKRLTTATEKSDVYQAEADQARLKPERRQISVLFADLIGSTRLSTQFDAEDWAAILQDYHQVCATASENWGGRLVSQFGDGCMAIFGHPRINENDAERAVHAGLEMIQRMEKAGPFNGNRLKIRVAIATGRVVIGDLTGRSDPNAIAGETPNLAARLQGIADPQTLVIAPATKALIGHAFELTSRGMHDMKGFADPVEAWRVLGPRVGAARADAKERSDVLLGRETEIAALRASWEEARKGQTRAVLLTGQAGIGKSQLTATFAADLAASEPDLRRLRYFCSPFQTNSALHPFDEAFGVEAGVKSGDTISVVADKKASHAAAHPALDDVGAALIGPDAKTPNIAVMSMNPQRLKQAMLDYTAALIRHEATLGPVLVEFEDAHWADATSLDALARLIDAGGDTAPNHPIMVLITARTDFAPRWPGARWVRRVSLGALDDDASVAVIRSVLGADAPDARVRDIAGKAGGVPLFLREIARAAQTAGGAAGEAIDVPVSLEDSLMSRIDLLGANAKAVAQAASTLGRVFRVDLLTEIAGVDAEEVQTSLIKLAGAEVVNPIGDGEEMYEFPHALLQEAAYTSLLKRQSRDVHSRIVDILAADKAGTYQFGPETLARHYAGADMPMQAVQKLIEAGQAATARAAQVEANAIYRTALAELGKMGDDPAALGMESMVQALLGQSLISTLGYGSPDIQPSFERARQIAGDMGNTPLLMSSIYGLWAVSAARGEAGRSRSLAAESMKMFRDSNQPLFALGAQFMDGVTKLFQGHLDESEQSFGQAAELYDPAMHPMSVQAFGEDLGTYSLTYLQWISALKGDFVKATALNGQAMQLAATLGDKAVDTRNLAYAMSGAQFVQAFDMALTLAEQVVQLSDELCYPHWGAVGRFGRGWAKCHLSGEPDGVEDMQAGLAYFDLLGQRTPLSSFYSGYADALIRIGRHDEARTVTEMAIGVCGSELDASFLPSLKRLRAYCIAQDNRADGIMAMRDSLEEARRGGSPYFEFLSALGLAQLDDDGGLDALRAARAGIKTPYPLPFLAEADERLAAG